MCVLRPAALPVGTGGEVGDGPGLEIRARRAVFDWLRDLQVQHPDALPAKRLQTGVEFEGQVLRVLSSGQGIFKPAALGAALSVMTTAPKPGEPPPYEDRWIDEARLSYAYQGTDADLWTNRAMRTAWEHQLPLVYLYGVSPGRYLAEFPVYVAADDPAGLRVELVICAQPGAPSTEVEIDGRRYATYATRRRIHQHGFRVRVLDAYQRRCAMCSLGHAVLLDAAHIVPDGEPGGLAVTANGMSLCKIHHAAYDGLFLGVRPDLTVEVNSELLEERDGPMLRHGIQDLHRQRLRVVPSRRLDRPDAERLEWRYERFREVQSSM